MRTFSDQWALGSAYDAFMGRWSRALARPYLAWLGAPAAARWLELGCGTGALTDAILETQRPSAVVACEPAQPLLDHARRHITHPLVTFRPLGSGELPLDEPAFDVVISSLVLNFLPNPLAAIREMAVCAPRGLVAAAVWDYAGGMELLHYFWEAAVALDPAAAMLHEGSRFSLCRPEPLRALFTQAGLERVRGGAVTIATEFASFDDYWRPLLGGTGPVPAYVAALAIDQRDALAAALRKALPVEPSGRISLQARAWAVAGNVPSTA